MTPFLNQDDLVLGKERELLVGGKIQCLDPVSSNPIDIYTYDSSDDSYTVAENPIYLDVTSRPLHTYFSDQLVLCRLYKYIGDFSDPMIPEVDRFTLTSLTSSCSAVSTSTSETSVIR